MISSWLVAVVMLLLLLYDVESAVAVGKGIVEIALACKMMRRATTTTTTFPSSENKLFKCGF